MLFGLFGGWPDLRKFRQGGQGKERGGAVGEGGGGGLRGARRGKMGWTPANWTLFGCKYDAFYPLAVAVEGRGAGPVSQLQWLHFTGFPQRSVGAFTSSDFLKYRRVHVLGRKSFILWFSDHRTGGREKGALSIRPGRCGQCPSVADDYLKAVTAL